MKRVPPPTAVDVPGPDAGFLPDGPELLGLLLGDVPLTRFLASIYLQVPLVRRGTAARLISLVDDDLVARLQRDPRADRMRARDGRLVPPADDPANRGSTLVIRHVERLDAAIARYAATIAEVLPGPVDAHIYRTPAGTYGFGWHCDPEEVFILQTAGRKRYLVRENTVFPVPMPGTMPGTADLACEVSPIAEFVLAAGDWLYIPGGWWHVGHAEEPSTSLSLGIRACAVTDLLAAVGRRCERSARFRRRLAPLGRHGDDPAAEAHRAACRELAGELLAIADDPQGLQDLLRPLPPPGPAAGIDRGDATTLPTLRG